MSLATSSSEPSLLISASVCKTEPSILELCSNSNVSSLVKKGDVEVERDPQLISTSPILAPENALSTLTEILGDRIYHRTPEATGPSVVCIVQTAPLKTTKRRNVSIKGRMIAASTRK